MERRRSVKKRKMNLEKAKPYTRVKRGKLERVKGYYTKPAKRVIPSIDSDILHPDLAEKAWVKVSGEFPKVKNLIKYIDDSGPQEGYLHKVYVQGVESGYRIGIGSGFAKHYFKGDTAKFYEVAVRHELLHAEAKRLGLKETPELEAKIRDLSKQEYKGELEPVKTQSELKKEIEADRKMAAEKLSVSEAELKYSGVQQGYSSEEVQDPDQYIHLWTVLKLGHPDYESTKSSGVKYPLPEKIERKLIVPESVVSGVAPEEDWDPESEKEVAYLMHQYNIKQVIFESTHFSPAEVLKTFRAQLEQLAQKVPIDGRGVLTFTLRNLSKKEGGAKYGNDEIIMDDQWIHSLSHEYGHFIFEKVIGDYEDAYLMIDAYNFYFEDQLTKENMRAMFDAWMEYYEPVTRQQKAYKELIEKLSDYYVNNVQKFFSVPEFWQDEERTTLINEYFAYFFDLNEVFSRAYNAYVTQKPIFPIYGFIEDGPDYFKIINEWGDKYLKTGIFKSFRISKHDPSLDLEKAKPYTRTRRGRLERVRGYAGRAKGIIPGSRREVEIEHIEKPIGHSFAIVDGKYRWIGKSVSENVTIKVRKAKWSELAKNVAQYVGERLFADRPINIEIIWDNVRGSKHGAMGSSSTSEDGTRTIVYLAPKKLESPEDVVTIVAHELAHTWQSRHGWPTPDVSIEWHNRPEEQHARGIGELLSGDFYREHGKESGMRTTEWYNDPKYFDTVVARLRAETSPDIQKARPYIRTKRGRLEHVKGYAGKTRIFDLSPTERMDLAYNPNREDVSVANRIAHEVQANGGRAFIVGGFVRDALLGRPAKDIDIESYGIRGDELKNILNKVGSVDAVGAQFEVQKVNTPELREALIEPIDVSLPRRDVKTGEGHKDFDVTADPSLSIEDASRRRDLTINAMLYDPITKEIFDPFNGQQDIKDRKLRAVDENTFGEDSLRVLRVMRFAGQLGFSPDLKLVKICRSIDLTSLPKERIYGELEKLLMSPAPSIGLRLIPVLGIDKILPELGELKGVSQDPKYHPEGSVWNHTMMVVDEAAKWRRKYADKKDKIVLMLAALCHDLGKPDTTEVQESGKITTYGHDDLGEEVAKKFLSRITDEKEIIDRVSNLVKYHMRPTFLHHDKVPDSAIRRLARKTDIPMLVTLAISDKIGRGIEKPDINAERWLLKKYKELNLDKVEELKPRVMGRHLITLGVEPGRGMGEILDKIYDAQLEGKFKTTEGGIEWARGEGLIKAVPVKGFIRTRGGHLERVSPYERAGERHIKWPQNMSPPLLQYDSIEELGKIFVKEFADGISDPQGNRITFSKENFLHITKLDTGTADKYRCERMLWIKDVIQNPDLIVKDRKDPKARLFLKWYGGEPYLFVCRVEGSQFHSVTAYPLENRLKLLALLKQEKIYINPKSWAPKTLESKKSARDFFEPSLFERFTTQGFKSREKLIDMPIDDFLSLAKKIPGGEMESKSKEINELLSGQKKLSDLPFLLTEAEGDTSTIKGHEGRHRAIVFKRMGYETMPVIIWDRSIRWSEQNDPTRFDYVKEWPIKLVSEDGSKVVPFPINREDANKGYAIEKDIVKARTRGAKDIRQRKRKHLAKELKELKREFTEKVEGGFNYERWAMGSRAPKRIKKDPEQEAAIKRWLGKSLMKFVGKSNTPKVKREIEKSVLKMICRPKPENPFTIDVKKSRKNLAEFKKSQLEGKRIPYKHNGKTVWAKVYKDGLVIKADKKDIMHGSKIFVKSDVAKVTGIGKDGVIARTEDNKKYQVLFKDLNLWIER